MQAKDSGYKFMNRIVSLAFAAVMTWSIGCQTPGGVLSGAMSREAKETRTTIADSVQSATRNGRGSVSGGDTLAPWNWATGIPGNLQRAEVVSVDVPQDVVAMLAPDMGQNKIQLVSGSHSPTGIRVVEANGRRISNCAQFQSVVEHALSTESSTEIVLAAATGNRESAERLELSPSELTSLSNMVSPGESVMRVDEDGSPWVLIRNEATRCRMMVRAERSRGLVQVVLSLGVCWGEQKKLPLEVRADCDGHDLQCLTATDALNLLYGRISSSEQRSASFAHTSELDEYMLPTSYKSIQKEFSQRASLHSIAALQPALISLQNTSYPGPAPLGDARALSTMLLQKNLYEAGENERIGWILFADEAVRDGGDITIQLDLGAGPQEYTFKVPAS